MLRGMSNNTTRAGGLSPPGPSIAPSSFGPSLGYHSGIDPIRYDKDHKARRVNIVSPYMDFRTDRPAMGSFRSMLRILAKRGFANVIDLDGTELGIARNRDGMVHVDEVLAALVDRDDEDIPSFLGIRAVMANEHDDRITAKLKVTIGSQTKVKVRIRGTILKASWNQIRGDVKRRFHVTV
jgi:hypothetical protein